MSGMDTQAVVDALNAEIRKLTFARDLLQNGTKTETPTESKRSIAQRKRWAEAKRRQRREQK